MTARLNEVGVAPAGVSGGQYTVNPNSAADVALEEKTETVESFLERVLWKSQQNIEAWEYYADEHGHPSNADGTVSVAALEDFQTALFGAFSTLYELELAWDEWDNNWSRTSGPINEALDVREIPSGVAAFWL